MWTPKQWESLKPSRRMELVGEYTFIPRNRYGVRSGHYRHEDIVALLRTLARARKTRAILFVADMME